MKKTFLLSLGFAIAALAQDPATTPQSTTQSATTPAATTPATTTGQSTTKAKMRRSTTTSQSSTVDTTTGMKSSTPAASSTMPASSTTPASGSTGTTKITERNSSMVPRNKGDQRSDVSYSTVDQKGKTVDGTTKVKSKKDQYKVTQTPPPRDKSTNP